MRALGFCVSIDHARFMARTFQAAGLAATAIWADTPTAQRRAALADLRAALPISSRFTPGVRTCRVPRILPDGVYEDLVTEELADALDSLDPARAQHLDALGACRA